MLVMWLSEGAGVTPSDINIKKRLDRGAGEARERAAGRGETRSAKLSCVAVSVSLFH